MNTYAFRILNVFAREGRLTGNPLCVFEDARGLRDLDMQDLARQFNLSETTFILPSSKASARVRIFTPSYEMPFAGHPTLGLAHVVRSLGAGQAHDVTLEMKVGIIPVSSDGNRWTLSAKKPRLREVKESRQELADMLGLQTSDIVDRPLWVNTGKEQLMVPVRSPAAVERASPRADAFLRLKSEDGHSMAYVFADGDAGEGMGRVHARFFFPGGGSIIEDPATGSACANLGGWFAATRPGVEIERTVLQGEAVGRPSTLYLTVAGDQVRVGGQVLELARGTLAY